MTDALATVFHESAIAPIALAQFSNNCVGHLPIHAFLSLEQVNSQISRFQAELLLAHERQRYKSETRELTQRIEQDALNRLFWE